MSDISIRRKHNFSLDRIKDITHKVVDGVQSEFPSLVSKIDWNGDKTEAKVKGKGFTGVFAFNAEEVAIDVDLAFFAKPIKGKVTTKINERLDEYLAE